MRNTGPFTQYNRAIIRSLRCQGKVADSLLGLFGAGEAMFLTSFVEWAQADETTYRSIQQEKRQEKLCGK